MDKTIPTIHPRNADSRAVAGEVLSGRIDFRIGQFILNPSQISPSMMEPPSHFPRRIIAILVALAAMFAPPTSSLPLIAAQPSEELVKQVEAALPDSPGACVLVIDKGDVVFEHGFGVASVETNFPCTPRTNFRMASVSKQFTATASLMLVDRGKLSLDDALDKFFPGFPDYGRKITIRQLLTHTSGIPDYEELIPNGTTLQLDDLDIVQILLDTKEPLFEPGSKWQYSNSAYVLLGMIVEIAAGQPYHEFMAQEVFGPLQMNNSCIYQRGLNDVPHRALGHDFQDGKWVLADQSVTSATRGDGCVYTSLEDYLKWIRGHAERKLLSDKSHDAMYSPQEKTTRGESCYGYGWFLDEYRGQPRVHHNGDSRGFRLCVQAYPERMAAVVLQFNGNVEEPMTKVGERISDLLIFDRDRMEGLSTKASTEPTGEK